MNSIVEWSIGFISTWTLMMLLHAQTQWPQVISKEFWPFAIHHAVNIYVNCYQGRQGTAIPPIEEFTNSLAPLHLVDLHTWGCLVYVLDKRLQDGNHPQSKWDCQSWLGVYMGHSMIHSGNVISVYNPLTGHTTPQFHIVFDDLFQTIAPNLSSSTSAEIDQLFDTLWQDSQWCYDGDIPPKYQSLKPWIFLKTVNLQTQSQQPRMIGWPPIILWTYYSTQCVLEKPRHLHHSHNNKHLCKYC